MEDDQFVISIGDYKKAIYAKILSENPRVTTAVSLANTHTNRRLVAEKKVSDIKTNSNCTRHTYKYKNPKYKTIHECLIYYFANTHDQSTFMDNLVKFLIKRRFRSIEKDFQIFELVRANNGNDHVISERKLRLNPKVSIGPRCSLYVRREKKKRLNKTGAQKNNENPQSRRNSCADNRNNNLRHSTGQNVPSKSSKTSNKPRKKKIDGKQKKSSRRKTTPTQTRPVTRSLTRKDEQIM